jgi:hypothetical protein
MFKKFAAFALVASLMCTLGGAAAFAQSKLIPEIKWNRIKDSSDSNSAGKKEAKSDRSLKADISKLVAKARAGSGVRVNDPQNQPRQSNSLSNGVKIAIVAGIIVVVILIIIVVHEKNHFFDGAVLSN